MKRVPFFASLAFLACLLTACASPKLAPPPFSGDSLRDIDAAIQSAIAEKKLPSAVYHLERMGRQYEKAYGRFDYDENVAAIGAGTLFDIASLTKVVATTPSVLILVEEGKLALDARLVDYFPECANGGKEAITLRHLLTHVSGLPAGIPAKPPWSGVAAAKELACRQVVTDAPGTKFRYSDINFLLLGMLVERVSGQSLADFATQHIYQPLGMKDTVFRPRSFEPVRYTWADIAPTQVITEASLKTGLHQDLFAGDVLRGTVHDPTARLMGGVAGSAGLFSTARDLAIYARMLLNGGEWNGVRVLSRETVRLMSTAQTPRDVPERRALGFDIDSPYSRPRGSLFPTGSYEHPGSFGHTGFTGCVLWIDPSSQSFYVFLSNRVYPKDGAGIVPLYATLGTLSAQAIASTGFEFAKVRGLATQAPAVAPLRQSFDLQVVWAPGPVVIDGTAQLVYELHLTNFAQGALRLRRIEVTDAASGATLADFSGPALKDAIGRLDVAADHADRLLIPPGVRALAYLSVPLAAAAAAAPRTLSHKVEYELRSGDAAVVEGGAFRVGNEPLLSLGPPLRGGPWAAIYHPSWERGHRRVAYAVQGSVHIPGRFAIDWIKVDQNGRYFDADGAKVSDWFGYGAEVLAVADGTVVAARDGIAESATITVGVAKTTPDLASGNYIAVDLGGGRYAFYEHLQPGSIQVKPGDPVRLGQVIGRLGYTGESTGPHLHFHVGDRNSPLDAEGLPYGLRGFEKLGAYLTIDVFAQSRPWTAAPADAVSARTPRLPAYLGVVEFASEKR